MSYANERRRIGNPAHNTQPKAQAKSYFISTALCSLSEKRVLSVVGFPGPRSNFKGFFILISPLFIGLSFTACPEGGGEN